MVDRRASSLAHDAGDQIAALRDTIADLSDRVSSLAADRARSARKSARAAAKSLSSSSNTLYDDGVEALHDAADTAVYYGRRAGRVVQSNPGLSLAGLALGIGVVAALVYASQREEDRRWYERGGRRGGWF
ncbi:hypothetical protein GCM10008171_05120 [Methylopila jiangsuensis]|uniref:DUF883 domain-containing protein n=1 Tax=Methylopila jiangsuensis TaxID=586230 RepID=A0A9W6JFD0_9HYPH|nr:hypothetical protein [Methylopila jiangsuensis]MDR6285500.1 ElaB/YqjD/DUF883 family membrane-anchored ribosome-binding protein [Methylopila jiangsuensis]GLK75258.1 hypothetical protein GCM10008171_05120 [Methylopila jiangsuensis]